MHVLIPDQTLRAQLDWLLHTAAPKGSTSREVLVWVGIVDVHTCTGLAALLRPKGWLLAAVALKQASIRCAACAAQCCRSRQACR